MFIRRSFAALAAMLAIPLLALVPTARASDLCIDAAQGATPTTARPIFVLRSFKIPGKDQCKFVKGVLVGEASAVTGSACTSFDGDHVTFALTVATAFEKTGPTDVRGGSSLYAARIKIGILQGGLVYSESFSGTSYLSPVTAYECKKAYPDNL